MQLRESLVNLAITVALVCAVAVLALVLKGQRPPMAVPIQVATPVKKLTPEPELKVQHPEKKTFDIFVDPKLIPSPSNEPDTMRFRVGNEELIFTLYFVDAVDMTLTHTDRVKAQGDWFGKVSNEVVIAAGKEAYNYVKLLVENHPTRLLTRWEQPSGTDRYYAIIQVEIQKGKWPYLADLLCRQGYARVYGGACDLPESAEKSQSEYLRELRDHAKYAQQKKLGIWAKAK